MYIGKNGYRYINRTQSEHRAVMEQYLGRKLERHEHIHHINHDRLDNRLENLKLVDRQQHGVEHRGTHCKYGHLLAGDNLTLVPTKKGIARRCRICRNRRANKYEAARAMGHREKRLAVVEGVRKDYGKMPVKEVAKKYGISCSSIYRYLKATPTKLGYL